LKIIKSGFIEVENLSLILGKLVFLKKYWGFAQNCGKLFWFSLKIYWWCWKKSNWWL